MASFWAIGVLAPDPGIPNLLHPEVLARWTDEAPEATDSAVQSPRSVLHEAPPCAIEARALLVPDRKEFSDLSTV
jgi:hypothetical protein